MGKVQRHPASLNGNDPAAFSLPPTSSSRERRAFRVLAYSLRLRHAFRRFARRSAGSRRSCRGALPVLLVRLVGGAVRHGWERLLLPLKVEVAIRRLKALIGVLRWVARWMDGWMDGS